MDKATLEKLKADLYKIIIAQNEYEKEKKNKIKNSIDQTITKLKSKLCDNYNLITYDKGIEGEMYKTNLFIFDVEQIILKLEKNESKE